MKNTPNGKREKLNYLLTNYLLPWLTLPEPPLYAGTISAPRDTEGRDRTSALTKLTFQRRKQRVSHTCQVRLGVLRKFSKQETGRMDRDRGVTGGGADKATCKWRPGSQEPCGHLREKQSQRREQQVQRLRHGASLAASRPVELAQGDGLQGQWCQIREGFRSSKGLVLRGGTGRFRANIMISPNEQVGKGNGGS